MILVGVSRSSKTPTCIYLANRGVRAANVPVVPGVPLPEAVSTAKRPLVVGLTKEPKRLIQIRRSRLRMINENAETDYVDPERVFEEVMEARRLFAHHGWPVIDVTRRSVEETAASILQMHPVVKVCLDEPAASNLQRADYFRWVYENKPEWQTL